MFLEYQILGLAVLVVVPLVVFAAAYRLDRWRKARPAPPKPPARKLSPGERLWMGGLFLLGFALFLAFSTPKPGVDGASMRSVSYVAFALAGVMAAIGLPRFLNMVLQARRTSRLVARANRGDGEGATADLRAEIETRGRSATRMRDLSVLLMAQGRWEEAQETLRDVELAGEEEGWVLNARGLVHWKLGRLDEALKDLEEARKLSPADLSLACNSCHVLADAGRLGEAREQLSLAEGLAKQTFFAKSDRLQAREMVEECRKRLATAGSGS